MSLVYFTCHTSPGDNIKLYNTVVSKLAEMCVERCKNNEKSKNKPCNIFSLSRFLRSFFYLFYHNILYGFIIMAIDRSSGYIINTCGWIEGLGYKCLLHTAEAFNGSFIVIPLCSR